MAHEHAVAAQVMTAVVQETHKSQGKGKRWEETARRLQLLDVNRTSAGVKSTGTQFGGQLPEETNARYQIQAR